RRRHRRIGCAIENGLVVAGSRSQHVDRVGLDDEPSARKLVHPLRERDHDVTVQPGGLAIIARKAPHDRLLVLSISGCRQYCRANGGNPGLDPISHPAFPPVWTSNGFLTHGDAATSGFAGSMFKNLLYK